MVDRNLIREFQIDDSELEAALGGSVDTLADPEGEMDHLIHETANSFDVNQIVEGVVLQASVTFNDTISQYLAQLVRGLGVPQRARDPRVRVAGLAVHRHQAAPRCHAAELSR